MTHQIFEERIAKFQAVSAELGKKADRIALLRLVVVVAVGLISWKLAGINPNYLLGTIPLGVLGFGLVIRWHDRVLLKQDFIHILVRLNQEEIARLEGKLAGLDDGAEFADPIHPYSADMDLFGHHSLFQLLGRIGTGFGRRELSHYLIQPASIPEITGRQTAVTELAPLIDWRQELIATGQFMSPDAGSPEMVEEWIKEPLKLPWGSVFEWISPGLPILFALNIALSSLGIIPAWSVLGQVILHILLNRKIGEIGEEVYGQTDRRARLIRAVGDLVARFEGRKWESEKLVSLQDRLKAGGLTASAEIGAFGKILSGLEYRLDGTGHFVLNTTLLWDAWWLTKLRKWKARHSGHIGDWFKVLGEVEALVGFAATAHARPDWTFPELSPEAFILKGEEVGHPLLPAGKAVSNPVDIEGKGQIWLITGSNMAGKSTYLRTLGVNVVLALCGAPVCAKSFRLSPMRMVSSMRTADSIEESTSSFYAELKRLRIVLETAQDGKGQVFFLLDEILKGTNSRDRHAGAMALVRQLHGLGASGLVSTHDLELAQLADELPKAVHNYSFHCEVSENATLDFDYRLREGVCTSMNATALMKTVGIVISS